MLFNTLMITMKMRDDLLFLTWWYEYSGSLPEALLQIVHLDMTRTSSFPLGDLVECLAIPL